MAESLFFDFHRRRGARIKVARLFNAYGPQMDPLDGRVVSNFILQALRNEDITLFGDGEQTRSFQYCDDLIDAIRLYMALPRKTIDDFFGGKSDRRPAMPVLNMGNPGEYTIRQLAEETLRQIPESTSKLVFAPLPADDPKRRKPDITLAKELLGWEPKVPLAEGLAKTIAYFRGHHVF